MWLHARGRGQAPQPRWAGTTSGQSCNGVEEEQITRPTTRLHGRGDAGLSRRARTGAWKALPQQFEVGFHLTSEFELMRELCLR